jgi:hypothetical protein
MEPLNGVEMLFMLDKYDEFYPENKVLSMLKESNGHAASFVSLLAMYHDSPPL